MTPASFAKLGLRLLAAGMIFLYVPYYAFPNIPVMISGIGMEDASSVMAIMIAFILAATVGLSSLVWFRAERLALLLLPPGAPVGWGAGCGQWQRWGLTFIGGWLALRACLQLQSLISVDNISVADCIMFIFNSLAALILIIDWGVLTAIFFRRRPNV